MANVIIHGGTFNSAQGDFHINNKDSGLHILRLGVSLGAIHDSAERCPAPNCHPDTRKAVRKIILDWIHCEISALSVFWLYGPAGAGKTSILQAIAEFLCSPTRSGSGQNFGGSFFFSRGKQGRDQGHFLFSTIAYQLALKVPGLRQHVNHIMELDPTLHTKSMDVQLQTLIVDAFQHLSPPPPHSYLVIIDGLDECHDKATQQSILRLLCEAVTLHKLPLRFLIGCRPESHIRASFDQESLYTVTRRVVLDETFDPGRDIRVFLQDGFAKIYAGNSILSHVEQPWPSQGIIDLLVQRSSGQFIYAATVLKFVGTDFCNPTKRLALVLKPDPTAFSDLDQLYTQILSVFPSETNIVKVLGIISVSHGESTMVMEDIFGMAEGELKQVLRGLSSLTKDEDDKNGESLIEGAISYVIPYFAHASFSDYLFNSDRSGPFHVNRQEYEDQVIMRSFAFIMQSIRSWRKSSITRVLRTATWMFFTSRLPNRFRRSPKVVKDAIITDIKDFTQEFERTSSDRAVGTSYFAIRLFEILQECFHYLYSRNYSGAISELDELGVKFQIMFEGYQKMLDQSFFKSKDLGDMLKFLPGVVVQNYMSMQGMADFYRIKADIVERLIKFTIDPLNPSLSDSCYMMDDYLSGFLQDRDRSHLFYCDPLLQHVSFCRRFLSLLDGSNGFDLQSHDLSDYVSSHFFDHLCAATSVFLYSQDISDDHPAVVTLHDLEITPYFVDEDWSVYILRLARCIIQTILRWANMMYCRLKGVVVSVSNVDLMERVCHLTNKIYREMLCITIHERMSYITMVNLARSQVGAFSCTPQHGIVLSRDLLGWITMESRIPFSFTNFMTTPELSGPFYVSPDIYHAQITEYFLDQIYIYSHSTLNEGTFREHLSRALPTELIFYLLRSIHSECFVFDTLEIIVMWFQGLGSNRPSDLYDRFQDELLRRKAPHQLQSPNVTTHDDIYI